MTGWIFDDSLTVCQPVQPVNQTRTWDKPPFMQFYKTTTLTPSRYRHVVQHRLAEQHRRHHQRQRLTHRRPRDAVQVVFMLKVVQVLYHADTVPVADA